MRESGGPASADAAGLTATSRSIVATTRPRQATSWSDLGEFGAGVRREVPLGDGQLLLIFDVTESLDDVLGRGEELGAHQLRALGAAVFGYLAGVHASDRHHGAICPQAVVRDTIGNWVVLPPITDGLSRQASGFAPPEGAGTAAGDVYSAAAVISYAGTGRPVTSRAALTSLMGPWAMPLLQGMEHDPGDRPSAARLGDAFDAVVALPKTAPTVYPKWMWGLVALLLFIAAAFAVVLVTRGGGSVVEVPVTTTPTTPATAPPPTIASSTSVSTSIAPTTTAVSSTTATAPPSTASTSIASTSVASTSVASTSVASRATTTPTTVRQTTTRVTTTRPSTTTRVTTTTATTVPTTAPPVTDPPATTLPPDTEGGGN